MSGSKIYNPANYNNTNYVTLSEAYQLFPTIGSVNTDLTLKVNLTGDQQINGNITISDNLNVNNNLNVDNNLFNTIGSCFGEALTYSTGTISASASTTVVGSGTTFTSGMVGGLLVWSGSGENVIISGFTNATHITVATAVSIAALTNYTIYYTYAVNTDTFGNLGVCGNLIAPNYSPNTTTVNSNTINLGVASTTTGSLNLYNSASAYKTILKSSDTSATGEDTSISFPQTYPSFATCPLISDGGVNTTLSWSNNYLFLSGSLNTSQVTGMYATPVHLLDLTISGDQIVLIHGVVFRNYYTNTFTAGGNVTLTYGSYAYASQNALITPNPYCFTATSNSVSWTYGLATNTISFTSFDGGGGNSICISNDTQPFTGGSSTAIGYWICYSIVQT